MASTILARPDARPHRGPPGEPWVRLWLFVVAVLILAMVVVGGATRLTDSGLSITEWAPILGTIPPLSHADWERAFALYREIPQFRLMNPDMTLDGFRAIFWWEWSHRVLGRFVGLAYAVPLVVFALTGAIARERLGRFVGLFLLGGLQGLVGWWMVASGLVDRVSVAPYRLAAHLTLAAILFAAVLATALTLTSHGRAPRPSPVRRIGAGLVLGWTFLQLMLGALVAGNDAGLVYNTWPLMGEHWVPPEVLAYEPWWRNLFENHATVQFLHRCGAYGLFTLAIAQFVVTVTTARTSTAVGSAFALVLMVTLQMAVGIATLVMQVPLSLAIVHQAMAMLVLAAAVVHAVSVFAPGRLEATLLGRDAA